MRHNGTDAQDNPFSEEPMYISSSDGSMVACLQNEATTIYIDNWISTDSDLESYPLIILTSTHQWNPKYVLFPRVLHSEQEEVEMVL